MASIPSETDAASGVNASNHLFAKSAHISAASRTLYHDGQLTWDNDKLSDEDIITITTSSDQDDERVIWSLVPSAASDSAAPFQLLTTTASSLPPDFLERHLFQILPCHLDPERSTVYVLISTRSGTGLALDFCNSVLHPLLQAIGLPDSRYEVIRTESNESVKQFAQSTLLNGANEGKNKPFCS